MAESKVEFSINITDAALKAIHDALQAGETFGKIEWLRISALPGGCSGFQYEMEVAAPDDMVSKDEMFDIKGVKIIVDRFSQPLLNGLTIDYQVSGLQGEYIFDNPNATGGCGCGTSFSV